MPRPSSKVFQDFDSPNQQIKKLKEVLAELGMTGRMSMDQAKTIKRKRELAKGWVCVKYGIRTYLYLAFVYTDDAMFCVFLEDVQLFEKAVLCRSSRSRSELTAKAAEDDTEQYKGTYSEDKDEDDEDEDEAPTKRPVSPYVLIHHVTSIRIYETPSWSSILALLQINLTKNDACQLVQYSVLKDTKCCCRLWTRKCFRVLIYLILVA